MESISFNTVGMLYRILILSDDLFVTSHCYSTGHVGGHLGRLWY
jgi:hypothetical protein